MARHGRGWDPSGHRGKLHRELGISENETIPKARLAAAMHSSDPEVKRDAIRADTMEHWNHGGRHPGHSPRGKR